MTIENQTGVAYGNFPPAQTFSVPGVTFIDTSGAPLTLSVPVPQIPAPQVQQPSTPAKAVESNKMAFSFASVGHALAAGLHDVYKGAQAVEAFVAKALTPQNQAVIEGLTALIPVVGTQAATVERGVFAIAGQTAAILTNVTDAGEQKLLDAGFDAGVIADFKALLASVPGLVKPAAAKS